MPFCVGIYVGQTLALRWRCKVAARRPQVCSIDALGAPSTGTIRLLAAGPIPHPAIGDEQVS